MDIFDDAPLTDAACPPFIGNQNKAFNVFWFHFKRVEAFLTHDMFMCVLKTHFVYF